MARATLWRWLPLTLGAALLIGVAGGVLARRAFHQEQPGELYQHGLEALEAGDSSTVRGIVSQLRQKGEITHSRLLTGRLALRSAWRLERRPHLLPRTGLPQLVGQMVLAAPGLGQVPSGVQPASWLMSVLLQDPNPVSDAGQAEFREALAELGQIRDEGEAGTEAVRLAAECLRQLDAPRVAAAGLKAILDRDPDDLAARQLLAAIYVDVIDVPDAVSQLRAWSRLAPKDGRPQRWIGWLLQDEASPEPAIAAYRQALQADMPPAMYADAERELARLLADRQQRFSDALKILNATPAAHDDRPELALVMARCMLGLGQTADAQTELDQLLRDHPTNLDALNLRAQIEIDAGHLQAALLLLRRAVAICPRDESSQDRLSHLYQRLGQKAEAEQHRRLAEEGHQLREQLNKACAQARTHPWDEISRYQIGARCVQLHRLTEAGLWLHAALACNPTDDLARLLLAQLDMAQQVPARIQLDTSSSAG